MEKVEEKEKIGHEKRINFFFDFEGKEHDLELLLFCSCLFRIPFHNANTENVLVHKINWSNAKAGYIGWDSLR